MHGFSPVYVYQWPAQLFVGCVVKVTFGPSGAILWLQLLGERHTEPPRRTYIRMSFVLQRSHLEKQKPSSQCCHWLPFRKATWLAIFKSPMWEKALTDTHRLFTTARHCPKPAPTFWSHFVGNGIWLVKPIPTQCRDGLMLPVSWRTTSGSWEREVWNVCDGDTSESAGVKVQARGLQSTALLRKLLKMNHFIFPFHFTHPALQVAMCWWNSEGNAVTWLAHISCFFFQGSSSPSFEGLDSP